MFEWTVPVIRQSKCTSCGNLVLTLHAKCGDVVECKNCREQVVVTDSTTVGLICPYCKIEIMKSDLSVGQQFNCPDCGNEINVRESQTLFQVEGGGNLTESRTTDSKLKVANHRVRYSSLQRLSVIYFFLGVLQVIGTAIACYLALTFENELSRDGILGAIVIGLVGLIFAISMFAQSDLIVLMIDLHKNTRRTAELLAEQEKNTTK